MKEIPAENRKVIAPFFKDAYDSCPDAYLDGYRGRGFADSFDKPTYGAIWLGDFCFLGGDGTGTHKKNVVNILRSLIKTPELIMVPLSESWDQTLSENPALSRVIRYSFQKPNANTFDQRKLTRFIGTIAYDPDYIWDTSISRRFLMKPIDENFFYTLGKHDWSKDFVSNYTDYLDYKKSGLGYVVIEGATGIVLSGASTFSQSDKYMEIQVATNPAHLQKGYATAVASRFVLACLKEGKIPCWDAANLTSAHIAQKIGYQFDEEYVAYVNKK